MNHSLVSMELASPRSVSTRKTRLLAGLMAGVASLAFAEKAAEISDDFIEYLGQMEDSDDNWSDFADQAKQDTTMHSEHSSMSSVAPVNNRNDGKTVSGRSRP
ncbi:MAG TPA: hypothetical protein VHL14_15225 [Steroidobacteraceae bacterium]|jgi:hypothetical protein|nr:hypothetical protein [Steroidobacteraceae bacterium]